MTFNFGINAITLVVGGGGGEGEDLWIKSGYAVLVIAD